MFKKTYAFQNAIYPLLTRSMLEYDRRGETSFVNYTVREVTENDSEEIAYTLIIIINYLIIKLICCMCGNFTCDVFLILIEHYTKLPHRPGNMGHAPPPCR